MSKLILSIIVKFIFIANLFSQINNPDSISHRTQDTIYSNIIGTYHHKTYTLFLNPDSTFLLGHNPTGNKFFYDYINGCWALNEKLITLDVKKIQGFEKFNKVDRINVNRVNKSELLIDSIGKFKKTKFSSMQSGGSWHLYTIPPN